MTSKIPIAGPAASRIDGLDTLRFVAAAFVVLSHGAFFPVEEYIDRNRGGGRLVVALSELAFNGSAAVLIFFVISGFCIHYPYARGAPFRTLPFLVRRILRISLPLIVIIILSDLIGPSARGALSVILWSLYAELIYYAFYPLLRRLFRHLGLYACLWSAVLGSSLIITDHWGSRYYWEFPVWLAWLVALPAWLLGCVLADAISKGAEETDESTWRAIWLWRAAVWVYSSAALVVFYHAPINIGHPALLAPFGFLVYAWIQKEICWFHLEGSVAKLEWAGQWSYSLYLVHNVAIQLTPIESAMPMRDWAVRLAAILVGALTFYYTVEKPSHLLARSVSSALQRIRLTQRKASTRRRSYRTPAA